MEQDKVLEKIKQQSAGDIKTDKNDQKFSDPYFLPDVHVPQMSETSDMKNPETSGIKGKKKVPPLRRDRIQCFQKVIDTWCNSFSNGGKGRFQFA